MKDLIDVLHKIGLFPVYTIGWISLALLAMTQIQSLNYIPKVVMLYILTPFVLGR